MAIIARPAMVYYAPTKGRRYFSKAAAIRAEARAIIKKHWPDEPGCSRMGCDCGDQGWSLEVDMPERHARYMRMLTVALKKVMR